MGKLFSISLAGYLVLGLAGKVSAQEDVRPLVEKAIRAEGGAVKLGRLEALHMKIKGSIPELDTKGTLNADIRIQKPDRFRMDVQLEINGDRENMTYILNGLHGWRVLDGQTQDLDAAQLERLKKSDYVDHVTSLLPLLNEKGYFLSALGKSQVEGRPALGIKVTSAGHEAVNLYFDQANGLLVQTENQEEDEAGSKTSTRVILTDYREVNPLAVEVQILKQANLADDGPALLEFFRQHTLSGADKEKMAGLVRQLGAPSFPAREQAAAALVAQGVAAKPLLLPATKDPDPEIARRAGECLKQIAAGQGTEVPAAAARVLALRRPSGAAPVLLAYLSSAPDDTVSGEVRAALAAVAVGDGKPDPSLVRALDDKDPVRRAAAAEALGRDKAAPPIHRLLIEGVKHPMRIAYYKDGKKTLEYQVIEITYFNRFEDRLFAKP